MSSALDEDTQRAIADGRETAGAMLRSAQKDLQKVFIVFLVGFMGTFYALRLYVWDFFRDVTEQRMNELTSQSFDIIAQTPFDVVLLQAKIALVAGIIIALPVFIYFSRDALRDRDMWPQSPVPIWKVASVALLAVVLFLLGMAYGYFVFFPFMFEFLAGNAVSAGFAPTWSIVMWAQFIFLLTMSFGFAAQMPLLITGLSYTEIVPYETFRDKWRYAVVLIFVFGAVFSPPDPFTQIMWAVPLLFLYGFSLYLAKFTVTMRRGSERLDVGATVRANWNLLIALLVAGGAATWLFYRRGGQEAVNGILSAVGSSYRFSRIDLLTEFSPETDLLLMGSLVGLVLVVAGFLYVSYRELEASVGAGATPEMGDPTGIDLSILDEAGVRAAPLMAFEEMDEAHALAAARTAIDEGEHDKAQAILDRYDEAHADDETGPAAEPEPYEADPLMSETSALGAIQRGRDWVNWGARFRASWNLFAVVGVLLFGVGYAVTTEPETVGSYLSQAGFGSVTLPDVTGTLGVTETVAVGLVAAATLLVVGLLFGLFALYVSYTAGTDPTAIDVDALSTDELRRAPPSLFASMSEGQANYLAHRALRAGDDDRASVVYERFDAARSAAEAEESEEPEPGSVGDRASRAGGTFFDELTDGETDEDDIGGYYKDIAFIVDTLTSKTFRIVGVFMLVLASTFAWLYTGGIGDVYEGFLSRVPGEVLKPGETAGEAARVIALHPVEALIFEVKFSTLVAALVTIPLIAYYAWPALRERGFVRGHRNVIFGWVGVLVVGLFAGLALGYLYIAPAVISYLVADALAANMVISYRISDFFWLIFFTTAGIGFLFDIPVLMVLLNTAGVSYQAMRGRWREVTIGIMLVAALFTPADVITMFLVTVPLMVAYGLGVGVLFVLTLGGRRNLRKPIYDPSDRDTEASS
jgi:sec-independent protein translocase protein TatC